MIGRHEEVLHSLRDRPFERTRNVDRRELVPGLERFCPAFPGFFLYYLSRTHALANVRALVSYMRARRDSDATEVAAAAVWPCSADASYVFGQMLVVDGA